MRNLRSRKKFIALVTCADINRRLAAIREAIYGSVPDMPGENRCTHVHPACIRRGCSGSRSRCTIAEEPTCPSRADARTERHGEASGRSGPSWTFRPPTLGYVRDIRPGERVEEILHRERFSIWPWEFSAPRRHSVLCFVIDPLRGSVSFRIVCQIRHLCEIDRKIVIM